MNAHKLASWITGEAYGYADGIMWPRLREHTLGIWAWRVAVLLGIKNVTKLRQEGLCWPPQALTMVGPKRAENIVELVEDLINRDVPGGFVDCGVWRGGSTIMMNSANIEHSNLKKKTPRPVYCCDTFSGFPAEEAKADKVFNPSALAVSCEQVKRNFQKCDVSTDNVTFLQGRVQETLHKIKEPVALLRADVDNYDATLACLEQLYKQMPVGAVVIIDDYGLKYFRCREAVDSFRTKYNLREPLKWIDTQGVYWIKEA